MLTDSADLPLHSLQEFKLLIRDKKEVKGLEPTTLAVTAQKAVEEGYKNATAEAGPWLITLDDPTYSAVVSFAKNRELRKTLYLAYRRVAAEGKTDNTGVIKQILGIRQELSKILGFPNYAEQAFLGKVRWCLAFQKTAGEPYYDSAGDALCCDTRETAAQGGGTDLEELGHCAMQLLWWLLQLAWGSNNRVLAPL